MTTQQNHTIVDSQTNDDLLPESIAIIGMAGRFPGAMNVREFWKNLCNGVETISELTDEELRNAGVRDELISDPNYRRRFGLCKDTDMFDAEFFGINAREAEVIDPQHRILLECAWEAFEDAGYIPEHTSGLTGVYVGCGMNRYMINYIAGNKEIENTVGDYQLMIGNGPDYLATRISYKLNLRGPSVSLFTACSTSMVAIHSACQSLLTFQCDMALAGGVSLKIPQKSGYFYSEGHILSYDGHCRAFDEKASGTVWSEGAGIVLLKRLSDAVQDGDSIYAVIKSTAINNDGSGKVGFTAPSVEGQAQVIALAHALADVKPDSISYVETHGTGTHLGDPIEIAGLTQAFSQDNTTTGKFCAIGSVKTNIGHLDAASGVAGLIKTALSLKYRVLPQSLHFTTANPKLDLEQTPFFVNAKHSSWDTTALPRRAGVSSFGIGGTNAHAILEETPGIPVETSNLQQHLLLLSARSEHALKAASANLYSFLKEPDLPAIADIAYTLQTGRTFFSHRLAIVGSNVNAVLERLEPLDLRYTTTATAGTDTPKVVFMFSGQGSQYPHMAEQLYNTYQIFKDQIDYCAEKLQLLLNCDIRKLLFPGEPDSSTATNALSQTLFTQPALFTLEYSLARLIMSWGIHPSAMIGHSVGEYVAACISGVFTLDDALHLIVNRARLMQEQPSGTMLSISAPEEVFRPFLTQNTEIALVNAPGMFVVGGPADAIDSLAVKLDDNKIPNRRLHTSHAFHTAMMDKARQPLEEFIMTLPKGQPAIPFISNVTGTWITATQANNPQYWSSHLRSTVHFSTGIDELVRTFPNNVFVEIGPGNSLCTLTSLHATPDIPIRVVQTVPNSKQQHSDTELFSLALGTLWTCGISVDWQQCYKNEHRRRVNLPTYPFERQRYWVESRKRTTSTVEKTITSPNIDNGDIKPESLHPRPRLSTEFVTPLSQTEKSLAQLWQTILGIGPIGTNDNFFELGGHSLLAVNLFSEIHRNTGVNLPLATLFSASTIKALAEKVDNESKELNVSVATDEKKSGQHFKNPWSYVVPIKPTGNRTPFFCVHGIGGNVLHYNQMIKFLDSEQPLHGIQCRGLDGISKPFTSIKEMATAYTAEIRQVQPHGPYILGGGSMGGVVAYEIAQQLKAMGETVEKIIMIDSIFMKGLEKAPDDTVIQPDKTNIVTQNKQSLIKKIRHSIWCRIRDNAKWAQCKWFYFKGVPIPHELRYWLVEQTNIAIVERYIPKPTDCCITLFRATHNVYCTDPYRGWRHVAKGGINFLDFPCEHENAIEHEDLLKKLGEILR